MKISTVVENNSGVYQPSLIPTLVFFKRMSVRVIPFHIVVMVLQVGFEFVKICISVATISTVESNDSISRITE